MARGIVMASVISVLAAIAILRVSAKNNLHLKSETYLLPRFFPASYPVVKCQRFLLSTVNRRLINAEEPQCLKHL
jgi:hypothetical protein